MAETRNVVFAQEGGYGLYHEQFKISVYRASTQMVL